MRQTFLLAFALAAAACGSEGHLQSPSGLRCSISNPELEVPKILVANKDCGACLMRDVRKELSRCPTDKTLNLIGMYGSHRSKDLASAIRFYESLPATEKLEPDQYADAGLIYLQLGKKDRALSSLQLAVQGGADAFTQLELAKLLHADERNPEASTILERIVRENPKAISQNGTTVIGGDAVLDEATALLKEIHGQTADSPKASPMSSKKAKKESENR